VCGIGGVIRYGDEPIQEIQIRLLLLGLEKRGNDAAGVAIQQEDGEVIVLKNDVPASRFVQQPEYQKLMKEQLKPTTKGVIMHTRLATKGTPRKNDNNHPMFAGKCALVHNGMLNNDDMLFRAMDLKREAETDTDIARAIVDAFGITRKGISELNRMSGSAAIAAFHPEYPGHLLLARSGNPIELASNDNLFVFASEKALIHRALRPWVNRFGVVMQKQSLELAFMGFPNDTAWIMGPTGKISHDLFRVSYTSYIDRDREVYERWPERKTRWDVKDVDDYADDRKSLEDTTVEVATRGNRRTTTRQKALTSFMPYIDDKNNLYIKCPKCATECYLDTKSRDEMTKENMSVVCVNKKCQNDWDWRPAFRTALNAANAGRRIADNLKTVH
jgi:asparagine synthetase B (glutamine-hydrolysing)